MRTSVTVLTEAASHDLTVVASLKQELNIGASDKTKDPMLLRAIRAATSVINDACGRPFGLETVSQRFQLEDWECLSTLVLARTPVVSVTSVTEGDDTVLDAADFDLFDAEQGLLNRASAGKWTSSKITVVYVGGYALLDALPDSIERACLRLACDYYSGMGRDSAIRSVNIPDVEAVTYADTLAPDRQSLPPDLRDLLRPYLRVI